MKFYLLFALVGVALGSVTEITSTEQLWNFVAPARLPPTSVNGSVVLLEFYAPWDGSQDESLLRTLSRISKLRTGRIQLHKYPIIADIFEVETIRSFVVMRGNKMCKTVVKWVPSEEQLEDWTAGDTSIVATTCTSMPEQKSVLYFMIRYVRKLFTMHPRSAILSVSRMELGTYFFVFAAAAFLLVIGGVYVVFDRYQGAKDDALYLTGTVDSKRKKD